MINYAKQSLAIAFILAGCAVFYWYRVECIAPYRLDSNTLLLTPDQEITHLTVNEFNSAGTLIHQLTTPFMRHIPLRNQYWMKTPFISSIEPQKPNWTINAGHAIAFDAGLEIQLIDHVILKHANKGTLLSDQINYFPKQQFASTPLKVTWTEAHNRIESKGMQAHLDTHHIDLLSQTRAQFDKGNTHVRAEKIATVLNQHNQLLSTTAIGKTGKPAHFWRTKAPNTLPLHAYADKIQYEPIAARIHLIGHARLKQGGNRFSAPSIVYDLNEQHLITHSEGEEHTQIVIHQPLKSTL